MNKITLESDPPFLQGIYLRDDFDLKATGTAFDAAPTAPAPHPEPVPPASTTLMDDEEFLKSLLTPLENQPAEPEPMEPDPAPPRYAKEVTRVPRHKRFPFSIDWMRQDFELKFPSAVTFFVGENGSGKSTLIEAVASLCGYPVSGGGTNDMISRFGPEHDSELGRAMFPHFKKRHRDGYFFRAEFYAHFASLLEERERDPEFKKDPYKRYGGKSLHNRSHGESFLALLQNRFGAGLYLMDEPESALSPQRQLTLLAMIADRVSQGKSQFIIATHSPILMTFPGATIINFDSPDLETISFEETSHYHLTRGILENPEMYWQHLVPKNEKENDDSH